MATERLGLTSRSASVLRLPPGEVRGRALVALGADYPLGDQLADRQRQVLGRRPELLVDLLDAQTRIRLDERRKLPRERVEVRRGALGAATATRPAGRRRHDECGSACSARSRAARSSAER